MRPVQIFVVTSRIRRKDPNRRSTRVTDLEDTRRRHIRKKNVASRAPAADECKRGGTNFLGAASVRRHLLQLAAGEKREEPAIRRPEVRGGVLGALELDEFVTVQASHVKVPPCL